MENRNIERLSQALQQLSLAEENLKQVLSEINQERNTVDPEGETVNRARQQRVRKGPRVLPYSRIRIGERVNILNPSENQETTGEVIGATIRGFIRVKTNNGSVVRRKPKNLSRQQHQNE